MQHERLNGCFQRRWHGSLLGEPSIWWKRGNAASAAGLRGVKEICATRATFAALKEDGSVHAWGDEKHGADTTATESILCFGVTLSLPSKVTAVLSLGATLHAVRLWCIPECPMSKKSTGRSSPWPCYAKTRMSSPCVGDSSAIDAQLEEHAKAVHTERPRFRLCQAHAFRTTCGKDVPKCAQPKCGLTARDGKLYNTWVLF